MQPFPDPTPFLRYGTVGVLLLIVLMFIGIGAYTVVKVATAFIGRMGSGNGNNPRTDNGERFAERTALRDAQRQLDELKAGSQPVKFWLDAYDASGVKAVQPLLRNQEAMMVVLRELVESQRRIRVRLKMDEDET